MDRDLRFFYPVIFIATAIVYVYLCLDLAIFGSSFEEQSATCRLIIIMIYLSHWAKSSPAVQFAIYLDIAEKLYSICLDFLGSSLFIVG